MKKLHLLCNAHLDPVWLWRKNEGIAEAISTFRVAADFCEEYDGFIFNHNESILYQWVEEHEPMLFARIQKLVAAGKWRIMGGWFLQSDCVMLSGESFLSQIRLGREYFKEKFGVMPTTAINFDPFGHSRGLVQILAKNGYDSYIFMRPGNREGDFIWEGFDGSRIHAHSIWNGYNSYKGVADKRILNCLQKRSDHDVYLCLWGIGNHGGGPSREDLEAIHRLMANCETEICHSAAEDYIAEIDESNLPVVSESLGPVHVGCYTSMVRIKQANRRLENKIASTEKLMSYASMATDFTYDSKELNKAKQALAFCQFHDILPGSSIRPVEEDSLQTFHYGEEIVDDLFAKAFFKLCTGQPAAPEGEIPILVFNPHPYEIEGEFVVDFMLQDQNWTPNVRTVGQVYDENGNPVPTQNEEPNGTFHLDWLEKVCFRGKLAPSAITRFNCRLREKPVEHFWKSCPNGQDVEVSNDRMTARISGKTGLIERYTLDGKTYLVNTGLLEVYRDNEDPWAMQVNSFVDLEGPFRLMNAQEINAFTGYPEESAANVRVVEDGCVRTKVQAFFQAGRTVAVVEYTLPKHGTYIDVRILLYSNEPNKMIKYKLDTTLQGTPYGETAFGFEPLASNLQEAVYHKWCGIQESDKGLYVLNRGTYGGSFTGSEIKLSLLRTPMYSCHPIGNLQRTPQDRFMHHMDMGEREFFFRITADGELSRQAQAYNEEPYVLSFFPSGEGTPVGSMLKIDHPNVLLSSLRKTQQGYELTLYNASEEASSARICLLDQERTVSFTKHEYKTLLLHDNVL